MDSSDRGRFVRRNSFRFGQVAHKDMARLLDDEDDGDDMGLLETESLRIDVSQHKGSVGSSPLGMSIAPDAPTEKAARRGSFRLSTRPTTAECNEDQTKRTVFRRGSFRLNRRASLDTGTLLGSDLSTEEQDDAEITETAKELVVAPARTRRMSLDMSSFLDAHESSPKTNKIESEPPKAHVRHVHSRPTECSNSNDKEDPHEASSSGGETGNRDVPPAKELGTSRNRARQVRRTKSHGVGHGTRSDRELRRTKSCDVEAGECKSPGRDARESPDQESQPKNTSRPKRREPIRRSVSSSAPSNDPTKSSEGECSSPRRRTCVSRGTRHLTSESRQSSSKESDRDSSRTKATANPERVSPSKPTKPVEEERSGASRANGHRSKPKISNKDQADKSKVPDAAMSSNSKTGGSRRSESRSRSVCSRRSESRSCSRSRSSRGEHTGRRSRETDECLGGATLVDNLMKPRPQTNTGYLPTAFTTRNDSDSEDDSNCYDDASECSSSIQLDILNPALVDHYVSAAVSLGSRGHGDTRDFVGASISVVPDGEDDELSDDDESFNGEAAKSVEDLRGVDACKAPTTRGPLPFNSVLDHFGFRRRTEGSPAC